MALRIETYAKATFTISFFSGLCAMTCDMCDEFATGVGVVNIAQYRTCGMRPKLQPRRWNYQADAEQAGGVTLVTMFLIAPVVSETPSPSSRPSRRAESKVKGAYFRVEIAARQYNPNSLTLHHGKHLPVENRRQLFSCQTASVKV